jgi:FMN-dependent NADH-azoreductase
MSLAKLEFKFMGFSDIRGVLGEGLSPSKSEEAKARLLDEAVEQVKAITQEWYGEKLLETPPSPVLGGNIG